MLFIISNIIPLNINYFTKLIRNGFLMLFKSFFKINLLRKSINNYKFKSISFNLKAFYKIEMPYN
jgi:hypothetical protein